MVPFGAPHTTPLLTPFKGPYRGHLFDNRQFLSSFDSTPIITDAGAMEVPGTPVSWTGILVGVVNW